jgi:uncharacterized membrane protein YhaH (DUF805 family)
MTQYCFYCGVENLENAQFCSQCGKKLQYHESPIENMANSIYKSVDKSDLSLDWAFFSFEGRMNRKRYWQYWFLSSVIGVIISLFTSVEDLKTLVWLGLLFVQTALNVKRWHDLNKSGWFSILNFIPFVGFIVGSIKGTDGDNQYGSDIVDL